MKASVAYPVVLGVYSLKLLSELGSGATATQRETVTYWYVRQTGEAAVELQPLSTEGLPSGLRKNTDLAGFLKAYAPEPFHYNEHPVPVLESLADKLLDADSPASLARLERKERAALAALLVDPMDLPEASAPGFADLAGPVLEAARSVLKLLLLRCETTRLENRLRFSGFGVRLRKDGHFDEALSYFAKALALERADENIHFNLARVYYDMGDLAGCRKALEQALEINPEFSEAGQFARFLARKSFSPA